MRIDRLIWMEAVVEKITEKHAVSTDEVEQVFRNVPKFRRGPRGKRVGEDLYYAFGQTDAGRYLFIVFIFKREHRALVLSARDMEADERRWFQGT